MIDLNPAADASGHAATTNKEKRSSTWFGRPTGSQVAMLVVALVFAAGSIGFGLGSRRAQPNRVDVGFLTDMITHHEAAIEMSKLALAGPLPDGARSFVLEVVADQGYEIGLMESQLRNWGRPRDDGDGLAMGWTGEDVDEDAMPGMATEAELAKLGGVDGGEAAGLWFALMTRHHEGALHMTNVATTKASDPFVRSLATRIARNQLIEINEYAAATTRLGLPPPPRNADRPPIGGERDPSKHEDTHDG